MKSEGGVDDGTGRAAENTTVLSTLPVTDTLPDIDGLIFSFTTFSSCKSSSFVPKRAFASSSRIVDL